jgi:hypothetical protein
LGISLSCENEMNIVVLLNDNNMGFYSIYRNRKRERQKMREEGREHWLHFTWTEN